ncbi:hypothetical protein Gorai_007199 [Gossypium raimondii]|uniref:Uncharacterized protein n=1 Tax=Gossypium raimondii TaxID=29730 RepID=A0A7J8Q7W7_GOSRA|nr:hypothetical protein [Gossypium raimondii]
MEEGTVGRRRLGRLKRKWWRENLS